MIADTSFIIAVAIDNQPRHAGCIAVYQRLNQIILPQIVLAETVYLLEKYGGKSTVVRFMRSLPVMKYRVEPLTDTDLQRATDLYARYIDTRLDFVDASVIALAERLNIQTVLTLDHRDFRLVKPAHCAYLTLLPQVGD